jgi:hypothetical protein
MTEITVTAKGSILDRMTFAAAAEAERYKSAVRNWGNDNGILVGIWVRTIEVPALAEERHWLLPPLKAAV